MWSLEETSKERSLVLGTLKLINQEMVLQVLNQSLKLVQLKWYMKRLVMVIRRELLE